MGISSPIENFLMTQVVIWRDLIAPMRVMINRFSSVLYVHLQCNYLCLITCLRNEKGGNYTMKGLANAQLDEDSCLFIAQTLQDSHKFKADCKSLHMQCNLSEFRSGIYNALKRDYIWVFHFLMVFCINFHSFPLHSMIVIYFL